MKRAGLGLLAGLAAFATLGTGIALPDLASAAVKKPVVSWPAARATAHVNTPRRTVSTHTTTHRATNTARVKHTTSVNAAVRRNTSHTKRVTTHVTHTPKKPLHAVTPLHTVKPVHTVKPLGHSTAVHAAVGAAGAAALLHAHSKSTKPAHVRHNAKHMVGNLGKKYNHHPVIFSKHGHFFRRHYYSMLVGGVVTWFWYDDAVYDYDPVIPTLVSVPVCETDDTDDCEARPLASVRPAAYRPPPAPVGGACELAVFWEPNFAGERMVAKEDMPYVGDQWNDHVTSIQIKAGSWEFYQDPEYGGDMVKMTPGPYPQLEDNFSGKISSFRCVK